ncbi:MAG: ATP-binding cassette domain-containing protein [Betaproteobacteria bacterium]|nr:ATP-binding cassette domain-containing protein [Betaproteobacteria bacterium]
MSAAVELDQVSADFGTFRAVDKVSVTINAGEFFSFLGPSGCGKTTILRMISGFIAPTEGTIKIGGADMDGIRPNKRPTVLIFQNLALFPLMPVWENVSFSLEMRGVDWPAEPVDPTTLYAFVMMPGRTIPPRARVVDEVRDRGGDVRVVLFTLAG